MLPLSSIIKDPFNKFEQDFLASNLPEGKYIKPPPSTAKWYKVGQPCYEDKIQELNTDFSKICITPKFCGAPMGKVPLPVLKELDHQARQNISTINFTAAFAMTSTCNATLEKCQYSLKLTFKKVKTQIQKGDNLEKAAKHGYEQACEYLDICNKTILIQHRALTCLSKSLAHIVQRELYTMGNTGLLGRRLPPQKGTSKNSQGFGSYQTKPFRGPHNKKRGSYRKCPYGGNSSQSSNQSFSSGRGKTTFQRLQGSFSTPLYGTRAWKPLPQ